jgi:putative sterol carrier protein
MDLKGDPADVYTRVTALDGDAFADLMDDPGARARIIDVLVEHMASRYKGDPDVDAVIHVKLWDKPGGGYDHRELVIADGRCTASAEPRDEPDLTLKVRPTDLRDIVAGAAGPRRLAFKGRLRVLGDLRLGMRLTELFEL